MSIDWEAGLTRALGQLLGVRAAEVGGAELLRRYAVAEEEFEAGEYRRYREVLKAVAQRLANDAGVTIAKGDAERFAASVAEWEPFSDTVEALKRLKGRFKLIILSNVDRDLFAVTNRKLQVEFDGVITAEDVGSYKPSPRNFETLLAVVEREKHVHVAQSLFHDHAPAQAMGIRSVWINRYRQAGGAVLDSDARYDLELPDLRTLAKVSGA
ncbi:MAG: HAD family hydrolase [Acidobacteriaceae bacterium]